MRRRDFLGALLAGPLVATARAADPKLRITEVEPVLLPGGKCFVVVRTNEGVTGFGEVSPMNARTAASLISTAFRPLLIGKNPLEIDRCWEAVFYPTYKQGVMGLHPQALAGIDLALWDILGKVSKLSVSTLLGGRRRESVRMYCSIGGGARSTPGEMAKRASKAVEEGFTAIKIRLNRGPTPPDADPKADLAILAAVRDAIGPEIELKFDVNNGYSVATAIRVGKAIADPKLNVIHYEEPLAQTDYAGYAKVVDAVDVPVAAGEHEYTRWQFRDLITQANVDILQPDLVKCAGLSEAVRIAALASAHHKLLVPHQTQPTIGTAANLHFCAVFAASDMAQELSEGAMRSPLHDLCRTPLQYRKGRLMVPTGPGLGLDIDETQLLKMQLK